METEQYTPELVPPNEASMTAQPVVTESALASGVMETEPVPTCLAAYKFSVPDGPPGLMYGTPIYD